MIKLNKDQIKSLLLNAYGFISRGNDLYFCQEDYVHDETFELIDIDGNCIEFTYNNASFAFGNVTFQGAIFGKDVTFTVLVVPTDISNLID